MIKVIYFQTFFLEFIQRITFTTNSKLHLRLLIRDLQLNRSRIKIERSNLVSRLIQCPSPVLFDTEYLINCIRGTSSGDGNIVRLFLVVEYDQEAKYH